MRPVVPTSRRGSEKWGTPKFVGVDDTDTLAMTAGRLRKDVRKSLVLSLKLVAGTKMGCPMSRAVCETWEAADPGHPPFARHGRPQIRTTRPSCKLSQNHPSLGLTPVFLQR